MGEVVDCAVDSGYSISNDRIILDCKPWLEEVEAGQTYLGMYMVINQNWKAEDWKEEEHDTCRHIRDAELADTYTCIGLNFEMVTTKGIISGDVM